MPSSEFSDVFVSYRRLNVEFVKRLVEDLQAQDKEVWVDWEDIPPGVEGFADEIKRGLEGADTFIAVLSPDYLESTYCVDLELQYAVELKKKIIPIVLHKFDDYPIPEGISHINWIYFTPHAGQANAYDEAFPKILQVMDTDLEHVRQHKRFMLRAIEWDENNRLQSFLLNGEEIENAQTWLAHGAGKEPIPNDLHREYIASSVKHRQRQQQLLLSGVTVALIVSIALAILSLIGFNNASIAQAEAETNEAIASTAQAIAESNESIASTAQADAEENEAIAQTAQAEAEENEALAEDARLEAEKNLEDARQSQSLFHGDLAQQQANFGLHQRALILALEALKFHQNDIVSDSAYGAVHEAIHQPIKQTLHLRYPKGILSVIWHDDGEHILIATDEDSFITCPDTIDCTPRVEIWDVLAHEIEVSLAHEFAVTMVQWNQATNQVLTLSHDEAANQSRIILWDTETTTEIYRLDANHYIDWILWQAGQDYFITSERSFFSCGFGNQPACENRAVAYEYTSGEAIYIFPQDSEVVRGAFSPNNQFVEVTIREVFDIFNVVYDFTTGEPIMVYPEMFGHFIWQEDNSLAILSSSDGITAQNLQTSDILYNISSTQSFTGTDTTLLINQPEGCTDVCEEIAVYDALTGVEQFTTSHEETDGIIIASVIQDGRFLLIQSNDNPVACPTCQSAFYLWSLETGELLHTFDYNGSITARRGGFELNGDETLLVSYALTEVDHNIVQLWDIETGEELLNFDLDLDRIENVTFDVSDQHVIVNHGGFAGIYDITSGNLQYHVRVPTRFQDVRVLHDEQMIVTHTLSTLNFWEVVDWGATLRNPMDINIIGDAYNTHKTKVVTWSGNDFITTDGTNAYIWDVETGKLLHTLETDSPVDSAEWSPDEKLIAVSQWSPDCGGDCAIGTVIFDANTGERLATHDGLGGVGFIEWIPDSSDLMFSSDTMTIFDALTGDIRYRSNDYLPVSSYWKSDYSAFTYQDFDTSEMHIIAYPSGEITQTLPLTTFEYAAYWVNQEQTLALLVENGSIAVTDVVGYDVDSAEEIYRIPDVSIYLPSNDGRHLLIVTEGKQVHLVDSATGDILWTVPAVDEQWTDIIWSPDDSKVIIAGFLASQSQLFDVANGRILQTFPYSDLDWSPDGKLILMLESNQRSDTWRVYDVESERVIVSLQPSSTPHWTPDSRGLVSHDGRWSVDFGELFKRGEDQKIRLLTDLELQEFFIKPPPDNPTELVQQALEEGDDEEDDDEE